MNRCLVLVAAVAALPLSPALRAQDDDPQAALKQRRAEKLAKPFLKNAAWRLDYDKARAEAKESGKFVLVYFTRSFAP